MTGGPWIVGGRTYREWRKVPAWFRKRARGRAKSLPTLERMRTLRMWRQTLLRAFVFALLVFLVAEALWQL
jgi:hypothetical protein